VTDFRTVAPVLPVADLDRAVAHYEALGFTVTGQEQGWGYAFANRDDVWLHLSVIDGYVGDPSVVSVYLYVGDADALGAEWAAAGVGGSFRAPGDTDYGMREGHHIDPDGNLLRYGTAPEG
jgi:catechol 2,3-dioxygenase-like lactoylglutathione lyase family enzyme